MIASWGRLAIAYIRPKYIVYALMMSVFIAVVYEIPLDFAVIIVFGIMLAVVVLVHLMIEKLFRMISTERVNKLLKREIIE